MLPVGRIPGFIQQRIKAGIICFNLAAPHDCPEYILPAVGAVGYNLIYRTPNHRLVAERVNETI
jgi:hypothetical protein